jgi:hypothetical protein
MARSTLTINDIDADGTGDVATTSPGTGAGNGLEFDFDATHRTFIYVTITAGGPETVTILTPGDVDGNAIAERTITVGDGEFHCMHASRAVYRQSDGKVYIDFTVGGANVKVRGFRVIY